MWVDVINSFNLCPRKVMKESTYLLLYAGKAPTHTPHRDHTETVGTLSRSSQHKQKQLNFPTFGHRDESISGYIAKYCLGVTFI